MFFVLTFRTTDVLQVVSGEDKFTNIDLKDTYLHVLVAPNHSVPSFYPWTRTCTRQVQALAHRLDLHQVRCSSTFSSADSGIWMFRNLDDWLIATCYTTILAHVTQLELTVNFAEFFRSQSASHVCTCCPWFSVNDGLSLGGQHSQPHLSFFREAQGYHIAFSCGCWAN